MPHRVIGVQALAGSPLCGPAEAFTPKTPESSLLFLMSYYLSIELTDLVARKVRWREKANSKEPPPVEWLGTAQSATDPPGGYVVMVNDTGEVERSLPLWGPEGIWSIRDACSLPARGISK